MTGKLIIGETTIDLDVPSAWLTKRFIENKTIADELVNAVQEKLKEIVHRESVDGELARAFERVFLNILIEEETTKNLGKIEKACQDLREESFITPGP